MAIAYDFSYNLLESDISAIAYDFHYNLLESEISASTNADDIKAAHKMALLKHNLTVIKLNLNAIYSK